MIVSRRRAVVAAAFLLCGSVAGAAAGESLPPAADQPQAPLPIAAALSPAAAAVRAAAGQAFAPGAPERAFYAARGYAPFWLAEDGTATAAVRALFAWIAQADAHALPAARYELATLATGATGSRPARASELAEREVALTRLFVTFARDIGSGLLEPRTIDREIDVTPRRPDAAALLAGVAGAPDVAAHLDGLIPAAPEYRGLLAVYAEMRAIARGGDWGPAVPAGGMLLLGDTGPRVARLRARLAAIGDLLPPGQVSGETGGTVVAANEVMTDAAAPHLAAFDPVLEDAVKRFQARHGLNTDGIVGPATLDALNTSAAERAAQVAVNLERLRWLNHDLGERHVLINIAGFTMTVIEGGAPRFTTRIVAGQARAHRTPEFNDQLEYIVVNPIWNVPYSIASEEILPLLRENPLYLEENNMELVGTDLPPSAIDWAKVTRRTFPGRIKQRPGPDNALGQVKFLFPNRHSIYMHDTPSRHLFARDRRDFSHGCVRLADPYEFAYLLLSLQDDVDDPVAAFELLRARPGEQWVGIHHPIPVYVTYRTAWLDGEGRHQFRADVYRRDRRIAAALAAKGVAVGG